MNKIISQALDWKMKCYRNPENELIVEQLQGESSFTQVQDNFLLAGLYKYGFDLPNVCVSIRNDIL